MSKSRAKIIDLRNAGAEKKLSEREELLLGGIFLGDWRDRSIKLREILDNEGIPYQNFLQPHKDAQPTIIWGEKLYIGIRGIKHYIKDYGEYKNQTSRQ